MKDVTHRFKVIAEMPGIVWEVVVQGEAQDLDLTVGTIVDYDAVAQVAHTEYGNINCPINQMQKCIDKKYVEGFSWFEDPQR